MKEIVSIHIGQAGIQSGQAAWDLLCREHGCGPDGLPIADDALAGDWASAFAETDAGKVVPRCLMVDLDPDVCDRVRRGPARGLYHPDQVVSGLDDAASNYARGRSPSRARPVLDRARDQIRRQAERSDRLDCVLIESSLGGGTGSGLSAQLLDAMGDELGRVPIVQMGVAPSAHGTGTALEPYNAVLGLHGTLDRTQLSLLVDNRSLYDLAIRQLNVDRPSFVHVNRLIAQVQSALTASARFASAASLNLTLSDLQTNLVPYPRLHYPIVSMAPVVNAQTAFNERLSIQQITTAAFEPSHQMIGCDPGKGQYLACALMYRGDAGAKDVNAALAQLRGRRTVRFVDWCPTGFKVGINHQTPSISEDDDLAPLQRSVVAVSNTTAVQTPLQRLGADFDRLYERGAFLHWYLGEGMDKDEFDKARDDFQQLQRDYEEAGAVPASHANDVDPFDE